MYRTSCLLRPSYRPLPDDPDPEFDFDGLEAEIILEDVRLKSGEDVVGLVDGVVKVLGLPGEWWDTRSIEFRDWETKEYISIRTPDERDNSLLAEVYRTLEEEANSLAYDLLVNEYRRRYDE